MRFLDLMRSAFIEIRAHKVRSALTCVSLSIGVAAARADRAADADLADPRVHRGERHVQNPDAAREQRHDAERRENEIERVPREDSGRCGEAGPSAAAQRVGERQQHRRPRDQAERQFQ